MNFWIDVTSTASQPYTTGIQRVTRQLAKHAVNHGFKLAAFDERSHQWYEVSSSILEESQFPQHRVRIFMNARRAYSSFAELLGKSALGMRFLRGTQPLVLIVRSAILNFHPTQPVWIDFSSQGNVLVLPEITSSIDHATAIRDLITRGDASLTTFVHDLLPLSHPWFFPIDPRHNFLQYASLIPLSQQLVTSSIDVAERCDAWSRMCHKDRSFEKRDHFIAPLPSIFAPTDNHWEPPTKPTFVALGSIEPRKNLAVVADAFRRVALVGGDVQLKVIGRPGWMPQRSLSALSRAKSAGVKVIFENSLSDSQVQEAISKATAIIYCSLGEGYGLPVVESLSQRTPVITSDRSPLNDFVAYGGVLTADPMDARSIAAQILRLMDVPMRQELSTQIDTNRLPTDWGVWADGVLSYIRETHDET